MREYNNSCKIENIYIQNIIYFLKNDDKSKSEGSEDKLFLSSFLFFYNVVAL